MINSALEVIAKNLNNHFKTTLQIAEDKVIVSNMVNADGSIPLAITDKVVVCLVNIEQEHNLRNLGFTSTVRSPFEAISSPINLNLQVLIATNFSNYSESLKFTSNTIDFLYNNPIFRSEDFPEIANLNYKLIVELAKMDTMSSSALWQALGAKYTPSVIYKVRLSSIQDTIA